MPEGRPSALDHYELGNGTHYALGGQPLILIPILVLWRPRVIPQCNPLRVNPFISKRFPDPFRRHNGDHNG